MSTVALPAASAIPEPTSSGSERSHTWTVEPGFQPCVVTVTLPPCTTVSLLSCMVGDPATVVDVELEVDDELELDEEDELELEELDDEVVTSKVTGAYCTRTGATAAGRRPDADSSPMVVSVDEVDDEDDEDEVPGAAWSHQP